MNILILKDDESFAQRLCNGFKKYSSDYIVDIVDVFENDQNYDVVLVDIENTRDDIDSSKIIYLSYFTDKRQRIVNKYQTFNNFLSDIIEISEFQSTADKQDIFNSDYYQIIEDIDTFAIKQIQKNNITDLLQVKIENNRCYYNTVGVFPILQYYQREKITELQIVKHLKQIVLLTHLVEDYLLCLSNVLLDIENIFIDIVSKQLKFVYIPTKKERENEYKLEELVSYFLYDCDIYCDTQQLYPLFKFTKSMRSIKQFQMVLDSVEDNLVNKRDNLLGTEEDISKEMINHTTIMRYSEQVSDSIQSPEVIEVVGIDTTFKNFEQPKNDMKKKWNWFNWKTKKEEEQPIVQQPHIEAYEGMAETTLLISREAPKKINAKLINTKTNEIFVVDSMSDFSIGSHQNNTCYIYNNGAVSRRHAVIKFLNNQFVLVDSNSTNGTGVNGQMLPKGGNQLLHNGDIINIADESFQFLMD